MVELFKKSNITEDDLCQIARISYDFKGKNSNNNLLKHLIINGHESIFEHAYMTFFIKTTIMTARQWFRHRIASYNEQSGRFSILENGYCTPDNCSTDIKESIEENIKLYYKKIKDGVKKEEARKILPLSTITKFYWTVNLRSIFNFIRLRNSDHAQDEIRENAQEVMNITKKQFPNIIMYWKLKEDLINSHMVIIRQEFSKRLKNL